MGWPHTTASFPEPTSWNGSEPDPADHGVEPTDDEPSELDLVYRDLDRVKAAASKLLAEINDYYDVDDGIPNIDGEIMLAARALDDAVNAIGGEAP